LQVAEGESLEGMERFGSVEESVAPKVTLRVQREDVARVLSSVLDQLRIVDVVVEDPPLEEVLADIFIQVANGDDEQA
jgi:ABC-2 type transport system ATP-binding protein